MSDVEDEELAALRAAALASLKTRADKSSLPSTSESNHITPINTVVASGSNYSPYPETSNFSNQYSWRNQAQATRRNRNGNRSFPKVSQRSNLIVITPVSTEGKNSEDKDAASHLVLPQHKWCQSANEDSSSPKTYRRTGPTRFNRHESGSESSDSDYDNSDNDSYSNETILQDEPSDHFTGRSGESMGHESSPEKPVSERRLSFQNIDSDLNMENFQNSESTSVYKCLKTTYPSKAEERPLLLRSPSVENDSEQSWKHESHRNYAYKQYDVETKHTEHTEASYSGKSQTVNGGSPKKHKLSSIVSSETDSVRLSRRHVEVTLDNGTYSDLSSKRKLSNSDQPKLGDNDLRFELKKRMHDFQSKSGSSRRQSKSPDSDSPSGNSSRLRSSLGQDCTESKNHVSGSSSSQKRARSRSRSANGHRSPSPRRNRRRRSRSTDKQRPDRHHKRDRSQSLVRDRKRDRSSSLVRDRKRDRSRSPHQNHKRDRNSSLDRKSDRKSNHGNRYHRDHSRSSSSSSTSTSSSDSSSNLPVRSISSVIKPVQPKEDDTKHEKISKEKRTTSASESDYHYSPKKCKKLDENNSIASNVKSSVQGGDNKSSVSDGNKRVPVHMRLGSLPGKRVIQMTKDVEAAFVNSSSDDSEEEVNGRHRKDNFHVVCDINDSKNDESSKRHHIRNSLRSTEASKDRRLKHRR